MKWMPKTYMILIGDKRNPMRKLIEHVMKRFFVKEKRSKLECVRKSKCPDCHAKNSMLEGPRGGMNVNVKCKNCGSKFNVTPLGTMRI